MTTRNGERTNFGKTLIVVIAAVPFLYPFFFLLTTAGKTNAEFVRHPSGVPSQLTFANITAAWRQARLGPAMMHSVIAVVFSVGVTVVISCAAGFWFLRHQGLGARVLRGVLVGTMALPPPVFIIPLYVLLNGLSLTDNLLVLGLVYGTTNSAFGLYLMSSYYQRGIPVDVLEASELDGASPLRQFLSVVLPLGKPAIGTLAALSFVWAWSDLLLAVVLIQDPNKRTLVPAASMLADRYNTNIPGNAAAVVIGLLPMLLVFLAGQRYLQRGVLAGIGK